MVDVKVVQTDAWLVVRWVVAKANSMVVLKAVAMVDL